MAEEKTWYIFTFGAGQAHEGHYVRFFGTYASARKKMFDAFGKKWAFQYSESEWEDLKARLPFIQFETELTTTDKEDLSEDGKG